jgi:hypothetical protein
MCRLLDGFVFNHNLDGVAGEKAGVGLEERFQLGIEYDSRARDGVLPLDRRECRDDEDVRECDTENDADGLEGESHGE